MFKDKRSNQLEVVAADLGMQFSSKDNMGLRNLFGQFELFNRSGGEISNLMIKDHLTIPDMKTYIFDYKYLVSTGKTTVAIHQTIFAVNSKKLGLPQFLLKPENFFHRVANYFGYNDIDFEEHKAFSNQYHLSGDFESLIREKVVTPDFARFFTINKTWYLEAINYMFVFYKANNLIPQEQLKDFYKSGIYLLELLSKENEIEL